MIQSADGAVEFRESGEGTAVVFAPGLCSTDERRTDTDHAIARVAEALEAVIPPNRSKSRSS